jgi:hypothetical protein
MPWDLDSAESQRSHAYFDQLWIASRRASLVGYIASGRGASGSGLASSGASTRSGSGSWLAEGGISVD